MKLQSASFNRLLGQMGQRFAWRKSYACPCSSRTSGQADAKCPHCSGKGRLWGDAVIGHAGIVSREKLRLFESMGIIDRDDIMLSIPSDSPIYAAGQYDRLTALNRSEPFSVSLVAGLNDVLRCSVLCVDRAFHLHNASIVDLDVPVVKSDGTLDWNGHPPPAGVTFSLTGRRAPEFFCYADLPVDRPMHYGERLPRRVTLRKFDLFGR